VCTQRKGVWGELRYIIGSERYSRKYKCTKCAMKGTKVLEFSSFHRAKCPAAVKTAHVGATGKQGTMDVSGNSKYNVKREYTLSGREVL
jgi:hypothetical protein